MKESQNPTPVEFQMPPVLLLDDVSGEEILTQGEYFEKDDLVEGHVLTLRDDSGKHHYLIHRVEETEKNSPTRVHISPAKSQLLQAGLLLAILTVTWFTIQYGLQAFFG